MRAATNCGKHALPQIIRGWRPAASACCSSISARRRAPATGRCGAISASSSPTAASSKAPRLIWQPILQGIVLTVRPKKSGRLYASIWNRERNESPLRTFTRAQAEKLAAELAAEESVVVDWAMRYGKPAIAERLDALKAAGCERILVFPLYPQYSATTTATRQRRGLRRAEGDALAAGAPHRAALLRRAGLYRRARRKHREPSRRARFRAGGGDRLLSRHAALLFPARATPITAIARRRRGCSRERLGWREGRLLTTFQSRFGPRGMAAALYRQDGGAAGRRGREAHRRSSIPASSPIAWRRWRRSPSRTARSFSTTAASDSRTSRA